MLVYRNAAGEFLDCRSKQAICFCNSLHTSIATADSEDMSAILRFTARLNTDHAMDLVEHLETTQVAPAALRREFDRVFGSFNLLKRVMIDRQISH